jgi:hypothetical protein
MVAHTVGFGTAFAWPSRPFLFLLSSDGDDDEMRWGRSRREIDLLEYA